ncbi:M48 family metalloprotease [Hyphomicrobium sp.]|jgi:predicted Zn-dependent protease|uniref:M48 family metalloprotease n=1 Tax=Hyphomicrobium sp. TaxID=82 RepID=UPI002C565232|nr:M48 family metalloprotease [Hyphomicrobium sp.]HVZ03869.1 M48 family metalloprotease [Hyphomicrobium sp.]
MPCTSKAIPIDAIMRHALLILFAAVIGASSAPNIARAQGLPIIRDAEIEALLQDYAKPIFAAAGFGSGRVTVRVVNNDTFNAFVLDGAHVFIHTGTLMQAQTPNEVIGVIAHESGHIAGGHMAALRARIAKDQTRALLTQVLGLGAMVAGGVSGGSNGRQTAEGGQAIMQGGTNIIMKGLLAERRSQESAADQAGLKYLTATKQSGRGMLDTFERFKQQEYLSEDMQDPFIRSHPLSVERLARLSALVAASPYVNKKDPPSLQLRHDLMRAKLSGYLESPETVFNRYPASDTSLPGRYARAIATYFKGGPGALDSSIKQIEGMIHENPNYPYFYELKADLLMRAGKKARAIPDLRQALKLATGSPLIEVELADALQADGDAGDTKESIDLLRKSLIVDQNGKAYRLLANAYYKQGKAPEADAMIAQAYFYEGNVKQAQIFAKRAQSRLRAGSPEWLKNDDIINYKPQT